ncbi:GDP-L-fucose synthase family protein [Methylobacillus sp. Pita1]|uniref:GDP-L-fucose synthase family protein n=1 Tax=Methylobacillus sp. Pita1 TaxID=3382642 RepID=UPI0038B6155E
MEQNAKIYVAGHRGLVGSAFIRQLQRLGYQNIVTRTHAELDLTDQSAVQKFFEAEQPKYVLLAAAKVGGIHANNIYPAEFIHENLAIQTNVIHQSYLSGVKRLLFLGSSCIYPRDCTQPIKEEYLLTGPLEPTNRPYALAKIAGIEMCWSYNRQYGTQYLAVMPTNLYGPGDNYNLQTSHVLPALIRKFHEARQSGSPTVTVWGTGMPRRELLHSDDMAEACIHFLQISPEKLAQHLATDQPPLINIGCGEDLTISELANKVKAIVGYQGEIVLDATKPDGTMRKLLDVNLAKKLGWQARISLDDGIACTYEDYAK